MKINQVLLFIFLVVATIATPQVKAESCSVLWAEFYECQEYADPPGYYGNTCDEGDENAILEDLLRGRCYPFGFNF